MPDTDRLAALPLTPEEERLVRTATTFGNATFGTAVGILEVMPRIWATLDAERAAVDETCRSEGCQLRAQTLSYLAGVTPDLRPAPDALREAAQAVVDAWDFASMASWFPDRQQRWRGSLAALRAALEPDHDGLPAIDRDPRPAPDRWDSCCGLLEGHDGDHMPSRILAIRADLTPPDTTLICDACPVGRCDNCAKCIERLHRRAALEADHA